MMRFFSRPDFSILVVCKANICRSPMAEGLLRAELKRRGLDRRVRVDSAGTHASQLGHPADVRAQKVCGAAGVDLRKSRARQVKPKDFESFDYILAMDEKNYKWLVTACPSSHAGRITLLNTWMPEGTSTEIPDPYYGSSDSFQLVFTMLRGAIEGFVSSKEAEFSHAAN